MIKQQFFDPEYIVSFDKNIKFDNFKDYPELDSIATRWTSKGLENNYLRFNTKYSRTDILNKLSRILNVTPDKITITPTPDLKFMHQF